jgi:hypothetical protein
MTLTEDELTKPERCLCQETAAGQPLDLRKGNPTLDDPIHGADWDAARTVRAELLIELLTGTRQPEAAPYARAVKLVGARIIGTLDLEAATLVRPLLLQGCYFDEPINLREAQAPVVRLPACHMPSLVGDQLETRGNLELDQGFTAYGGVSLWGAHIGGLLSLDGAQLSNHDGPALDMSAAHVDGVLICRDGFTARGEVRLIGTHVGGSLAFSGANLSNPEGLALHGLELAVDGYMYCHQGFTTQGQVMLLGARIGGMLLFNGARLTNPSGLALEAARVSVDGGLFFGEGFSADGQVSLWGAQIGGKLVFEGAQLTNHDGPALDISGVTVGASLLCSGLTTQGEMCLASANIGGALDLSGARLTNPGGQALNADGITIKEFCGVG